MSLTTTCDRLVKTILSIHDANISESERMGFCRRRDEFLKSSPVRAECALLLTKHKSASVRVFAFETLSYCVKFKYRHIDRTTLDEIKATIEYCLCTTGGYHRDHVVTIDEQRNQLKIALIDLTVEVMKREWPALWKPSFFKMAKDGPAQTDLVLCTFSVLLRVIYKSDNLAAYAKKRLSDGLRSGVKEIVGFLRDTIKRHSEQLSSSSSDENKSDDNIIRTSVQLLREFFPLILDLDFYIVNSTLVALSTIFPNERRFFIGAVDCFVRMMDKIKLPDVQKFFVRNILISDLFERLLNGLQQKQYDKTIYYEYTLSMSEFLMSFSSLLLRLSQQQQQQQKCNHQQQQKCNHQQQLHVMFDDARCYRSFEVYTEIVFSLYSGCHWYRVLYNVTLTWNMLLDGVPTLCSMLSKLPESIIDKLITILYAIITDNNLSWQQRSECIRYEFQSESSYHTLCSRFLIGLTDTLSKLITINPDPVLGIIAEMIDRSVNNEMTTSSSSGVVSLLSSKKRSEWRSLKYLTRHVLSSVKTTDLPITIIPTALKSINLNFIRRLSDPIILLHALHCMENTMDFLSTQNRDILSPYLCDIVNGIFYCFDLAATIEPEIEIIQRQRASMLYKCAGNLLVKICNLHRDIMMEFFVDDIEKKYDKFIIEPKFTWSALYYLRSLIVLNNGNDDFNEQSKFIKSVMVKVGCYWLENKSLFESDEKFIDYIGLNEILQQHNQQQQDDDGDDVNMVSVVKTSSSDNKHREILLFNANVVMAALSYSSYPEDSKTLAEGGFLQNYAGSGHALIIDPCVPHVVPLLPSLLLLLKRLNSLWTRDQRLSTVEYEEGIFAITDYEIESSSSYRIGNAEKYLESIYIYYTNNRITTTTTNNEKFTRDYMATLYEMVIEILAVSFNVTMYDFFGKPEITDNLNASLLYNLHCIPDYRLSIIFKNALLMLIYNCPPTSRDTILIPLFERLSVHMKERLNIRWTLLRTYTTEQPKPANEQDALAYNVIKTLIDDYAHVLRTVLIISSDVHQMPMMQAFNEVDKLRAALSKLCITDNLESRNYDTSLISDVGVNILGNRKIAEAFKKFSLDYICGGCFRPRAVNLRVFSSLIRYVCPRDGDAVEKLFRGLLRLFAVNVGGGNQNYFNIVVNELSEVYSTFRPNFPILLEILAETILEKDLGKLRFFDRKILTSKIKNWGRKGRCKMLIELLMPAWST